MAEGIYNYYDPNRAGWQAPKYSPEVAGLLDADDDPGAVVRALIAEAREVAKAQEPTLMDSLSTLSATHRRKLPGRAAVDAQRQHFLDRALEIYGRPDGDRNPSAWAQLPEGMQADMRNYATNAEGFRDNIANPYEYTGWIGPGSRLNTAGKWLGSLPAAAYQASHMLANAYGNVAESYMLGDHAASTEGLGRGGAVKSTSQAIDDMADATGTLIAPVTSMLGVSDSVPTAWSRSDKVRKAFDEEPRGFLQDAFVVDNRPAQQIAVSLESRLGDQEDGEDLLTGYGVDKAIGKLPARALGAVMDDTLNPMWEGAGIVNAARAGKHAAAARGLAMEHAPSVLLGGYTTYLEDKLKRLKEAKR